MQAITEKKEEALREIDQKTFESLQDIAEAKSQNTKNLKATQTQTVENPTTLSEKEKKELQSYLIDLYRKDYLKTDLSPLLPGVEIDLEKVYVPLKMERRRGNSVKTTNIHSLHGVFHCKRIQAKTIFISGDAGMGKTTFCRKLISEWCHAHSTSSDISGNTQKHRGTFLSITSQKNISDHTESSSGSSSSVSADGKIVADVHDTADLIGTTLTDKYKVMKQFDFLFFVSLRDTYKERSVEEMTLNQLLRTKKMREHFKFLVENETEKILYILDGLDEWTPQTPLPKHPNVTKGLPVSSLDGHFTTLFTSRPWKVEMLRPKLREYDFDLSIIGIEKTDSKRLVWLIFDEIISDKDEIDTNAVMFLQEVEKMEMECLCSVPLLLKLLICLWEKDQELADSQTGIYSSIISKLCSLAVKRFSDNDKFQHWVSQLEGKDRILPPSLNHESALLKFAALMYTLGKFSFENISHKSQGGALVFKDKDLTDHGLSEAEYELSLKIGLLSKKKVIGSLKMSPVRCISFMHKTFQEYFAALYISMVFEQNRTVDEKVREYFTSSETIMGLLRVITFVKEMCPALIDKATEQVGINEKDFIITIEESKLTLQANLNNNTKLVAEFFMTYQVHEILVKSSNFGIYYLRPQMEMRNLEVLEFHTVKMTSSALKRMLESLPETSSGVSLKLCHVVVRNPRSGLDYIHVSITLNNLKSIEIDFMNMCGIETQFSKHMKTIDCVKYHEVDMNEKELEQLLGSIRDTDKDIVLMFNDIHLKNVRNEDSNILSQTINRTTNFQEFSFETKYLKGVTFFWSGKQLSCMNMRFSEATKPVDELCVLMERVILDGDLATIFTIKTNDSFQKTNSLKLINIEIKDNVLCELLQNEKMVRLRSLQLYNITITQTSSHTQQLALPCEVLGIKRGNIFNNMSIRFSKAVSSISVENVTMPIKCCLELLSGVKREHCKLELRNVSFTNILHSLHGPSNSESNINGTLCSESLAICQTDRAEIENDLNEALVWIILGSNIDSFTLDSIFWTNTCSSGEHIDLKEVYHSKCQGNLQSRQMLKSLYLRRISLTEKCLCSLFDYISSASVRPALAFFGGPEVHFEFGPDMTDIRLEDLTLTTHAFSVLIGSRYGVRNKFRENILSVVLDNITLIDTFNSYTEVTCKFPRILTIKRTNLLDLAVLFRSDSDALQYSHLTEILFENVTLTEKALCKMNESAREVFPSVEVELDDDNTANCKTIKRMRLRGLDDPLPELIGSGLFASTIDIKRTNI
ncbi:uncharacterized protein LOC128554871 isoform X2 [Mercenaria mercenaria]|nr:uncharacterized protein LOC128554871 isoform X2 [Mercenaria mercenaria]